MLKNWHQLFGGSAQTQGGFGRRGIPFFSQTQPSVVRTIRQPPMIRRGPIGQSVSGGPGGYNRQLIKKLTLDLSIARNDAFYALQGTILWFYRSTNTTDVVSVRIDDLSADQLVWGPGNGLEGVPFSRVYLTNAAIAGATAEIAYFSDTPDAPVRFF